MRGGARKTREKPAAAKRRSILTERGVKKMEQAVPVKSGPNRPTGPEIPWMKLWEKKSVRDVSEEDSMTRLVRIDFVTMLEELEFR